MAGYKGHIAGASVFFAIYSIGLVLAFSASLTLTQFDTLEKVAYPVALFCLCIMFGLWPDVDTNSKAQDIFYALFFLVDIVLIVTTRFEAAAYLGLFAILPVIGKHRGWTHTWWAMLLIPAPLLFIPDLLFPERPFAALPLYGAAVIGYFSHLFMDGLIVPLGKRK